MNEMSKQMEMFDDGGLMDEGGTVDPVSGNDVPPGSNQEEVRDDIPAQLSEGEFVFPADVVRYFGLERLMEMRQEAKMGLQRMDDMGQMGNSEEAIMPDNLPFDIDDIDMEDDEGPQEFNLGGVVQQPGSGIGGYVAPTVPTTGFTPLGTAVAPVTPGSLQPQQAVTPVVNYGQGNLPTFGNVVGTSGGAYDEIVTYVNAAGQIQQIPHVNGKPIYPVPEGYTKQASPTDVTPDSPLVDTTKQVRDDGGGDSGNNGSFSTGAGTAKVGSLFDTLSNVLGGNKSDKPKSKRVGDIFASAQQTTNAYGGSKLFGFNNSDLRNASAKQGAYQLGSIGLSGMLSSVANEFGIMDFTLNDVGVAGNTGMNNALNSMGLINRTQLMDDAQASLVASAMVAGHGAALKGKSSATAISEILKSPEAIEIQNKAYQDIKNSFTELEGTDGELGGVLTDKEFASQMRSRVNRATTVLAEIETGSTKSPSGKNVGTKVMSRDMKTGLFTKPTNVYTKEGEALKKAQTNKAQQSQVLAGIAEAKVAQEAKDAKLATTSSARAKAAADAVTAANTQNMDGGFDDGGDDRSQGAADDDMGDVGQGDGGFSSGEDTTSAASDNYDSDGWGDFNKGGLAKQMKRSGLASKK